uniref:(northern house mosquito) hypothetical protein n=2 Tax=Culex pipiens TaxID=7175 RepID=A0A8D8MHC2_CULPI
MFAHTRFGCIFTQFTILPTMTFSKLIAFLPTYRFNYTQKYILHSICFFLLLAFFHQCVFFSFLTIYCFVFALLFHCFGVLLCVLYVCLGVILVMHLRFRGFFFCAVKGERTVCQILFLKIKRCERINAGHSRNKGERLEMIGGNRVRVGGIVS